MMNRSTIQLKVEGQVFSGWKKFSAEFDMESLVSTFSLRLFDKKGVINTGDIKNGQACEISIVDPLIGATFELIPGYITSKGDEIAPGENTLSIEGAHKLVDILDCSAIHDSQTWAKKRFSSIVVDLLAPFSLEVDKSELKSDPIIEKFTLQSSESVFDAVERLCRSQAVLPMDTPEGKLLLGNSALPTDRTVEDLEVGVNLKRLRRDTDWNERFSEYTAIGQSDGNGKRWNAAMIQAAATAKDTGVTRYRPKLFVSENKATKEILVKRVGWESQVRSGRATEYTATISGWYQKKGGFPFTPWVKNKRCNLKCAEWSVDREVLITKVKYSLDAAGEITTLTLKDPDIFKAQPGLTVDLT